jgi:hypothetical protein
MGSSDTSVDIYYLDLTECCGVNPANPCKEWCVNYNGPTDREKAAALPTDGLAWLLRRRAEITETTPCTACEETMAEEFYVGSDLFDGVLNDAGEPFHHGCENF